MLGCSTWSSETGMIQSILIFDWIFKNIINYLKVPMNLLIMYMAGNSISIFPIMMVGMSLIRPMKAIFSTQTTFKIFEINSNIAGQKFIFFIGNLINIGLALYKCHSMGLLPTHASDWLAFVDPQERLEFSDGGMSFL